MLLHDNCQDLYYDPTTAVSILFGVIEERGPIATLTYAGGATVTLIDGEAVAELRRWCDRQAASW